MAPPVSYFDHNARRTSWEVVEWPEPEPIVVEETDDEDTVRIVRLKGMERVERD